MNSHFEGWSGSITLSATHMKIRKSVISQLVTACLFLGIHGIVERLLLYKANPMSCVFQNIDPPLRPASVYPPPPWLRGEDTLAGWRGGWGPIFLKTQDTALYSTYIESSLHGIQSERQSPSDLSLWSLRHYFLSCFKYRYNIKLRAQYWQLQCPSVYFSLAPFLEDIPVLYFSWEKNSLWK